MAVGYPCGMTYAAGNVYVSDGALRRVNTRTDWLTTPAGDAMLDVGPLGNGGLATRANLASCGTPAVDRAGNMLVPDTGHKLVRAVAARSGTFYGQKMTAGHIYPIAGDGKAGVTAGGVPAIKASLYLPESVTVDSAGNLVLTDSGVKIFNIPALVQVVAVKSGTFYGQKMKAGYIYDIAGEGRGVSGNGGPALTAGLGYNIGQLELDHMGNVVICDVSGNSIRVIAEKTGTFYGQPMTAGDIYRVAGNGQRGFSGDGGPATRAELNRAGGVTVDGAGNLIVSDTGNNRVRVVAVTSGTFYGQAMTAGDIYSIAGGGTGRGDGGPATSARLDAPAGVAVDGAGNVLLGEHGKSGQSVLSHQKAGFWMRLIAVKTATFYGQKMTANDIYTVAGNGTSNFSGDGGPVTRAQFDVAGGVAFDSAGDLAVSDFLDNRIRLVPPRSGTYFGQKMAAGHIYTIMGYGGCRFTGTLGDGGPAVKASVCQPEGLRFDSAGNLLFADSYGCMVRVVAAKSGTFYGIKMTVGDVYALAGNGTPGDSGDGGPATSAQLNFPADVTVDHAGNLVIADTGNNRVRVVAVTSGTFYGQAMTAGDIYTVAGSGTPGFSGDGGPATAAQFHLPESVSVDTAGNLLVDDMVNERIRVVAEKTGTFYGVKMTAGDIYTVAGSGNPDDPGFSGDGGPATTARLGNPEGIQLDLAGNLLIGDTWNNRVRVVAVKSGTFYGIKMTADDIYTVAGNGTAGLSVGRGPATKAELQSPTEVTVDGAGNLCFGGADRVFEVTGQRMSGEISS